ARRPFDPAKIHAFFNSPLPGVIRSKGHFWTGTQPDVVAEFSLAGSLSSVSPLGTWWAAVPKHRWPDSDRARDYLAGQWQEPWGDRRQELVFIGAGIDWAAMKARLDECLVPEDKSETLSMMADMDDPFPQWRRAEAA
ncbi:MAG: GTP-binding protein, partial [Pseudomonadota bacterium]